MDWRSCVDGPLMLRHALAVAGEPNRPSQKEVVAVLCDIVEPVLSRLPHSHRKESKNALLITRCWLKNEASEGELFRVADAATDAAADASSYNDELADTIDIFANVAFAAANAATSSKCPEHRELAALDAYSAARHTSDCTDNPGLARKRQAMLVRRSLGMAFD